MTPIDYGIRELHATTALGLAFPLGESDTEIIQLSVSASPTAQLRLNRLPIEDGDAAFKSMLLCHLRTLLSSEDPGQRRDMPTLLRCIRDLTLTTFRSNSLLDMEVFTSFSRITREAPAVMVFQFDLHLYAPVLECASRKLHALTVH